MTLGWTANAEADLAGYNVYRSTTATVDTSGTPLNSALLTNATFVDSTVEPGTTYTYAVTAKDTTGNTSLASASATAKVPAAADTQAPAAPKDVTAQVGDNGVTLGWTANDEADLAGYDVYRSTTATVDTSGTPLNSAPLTDPAFVDSTVEPGTTYTYAVTAKDTTGNTSLASTTATAEVPAAADTEAPAAPKNVAAAPSAGKVELTWTANPETDVAGYRVYRGNEAPVATTGTPPSGADLLTSPAFTDSTVAAGSSYAHVIVAVDEAGNASPASTPATATAPTTAVTCTETQYRAEYFTGTTLSGDPVATRCESAINNDYGLGGPVGVDGLDPDAFSVRWTQRRQLAAGTYSFSATADDGVRVKVDGEAVIDEWRAQGPTTFTADKVLTAGAHDIVVEYYESGGGAIARASYTLTSSPDPTPATCTAGQWAAEYYDGEKLSGERAASRCEDAIDYDFGDNGPAGVDSVGKDSFSIRWTSVRTLTAGTYDLKATADDGIRVKVDGATVIDAFVNQGPTTYDKRLPLSAGDHTIVVEYYEAGGGALARFGITRLRDEVTCSATQYRAEYFRGQRLDGTPVAVRCEDAINNDYGDGGPAGVPLGKDDFSVRWTQTGPRAAGTYE